MRIGFIIGRIGGVDGVALETEKWIHVLRRMGHHIAIITGELQGDVENVTVVPALSFGSPTAVSIQKKAFFGAPATEAELLSELERDSQAIEQELYTWATREKLDYLVSENANALPFHATLGRAIKRLIERTGIPCVSHDHDFYWERGSRYETPHACVLSLLKDCYPIDAPNVKHAVINKAAKAYLEQHLGITDTIVVPNVMDFDAPFGQSDAYNSDLRTELGLAAEDVLLFQITRIVRRKGIETAVELVHRLADPKVKLIVTGTDEDDTSGYLAELKQQAKRLKIETQVIFAGAHFANHRQQSDGKKIYALHDGYAHADAMTYFSTYEGFGNAFVEAVVAKVPIFVNNYKPVYWPDIGSLGFQTVQIENSELSDEAVEHMRRILRDPLLRHEMTDHNFELGREHFSYQALERLFASLFQ
ncbi:MAG: glycosyltransferase family 4 protein [Myxococcales bacterium]|nr:glycosyltransferase family 4 protein [Myxococcales bacterium]